MSFINYDNIKAFIEGKINVINSLSKIEAAQVAVNAIQLQRTGNKPSNFSLLETYLQDQEDLIGSESLIKDVTLLLGASAPTKNTLWFVNNYFTGGTFTAPENLAGGMVYVTAWGGGGSGAAGYSSSGYLNLTGGCGGGFASKVPMKVTPNTSYTITVGAGGFGESRFTSGATIGSDGGNTLFDGNVIAYGGKGGRKIEFPLIIPYTASGSRGGAYMPIHVASSGAISNLLSVPADVGDSGGTAGANLSVFSGSVGAYCGGGGGSRGAGTDANIQINSTCSSDPCAINSGAGSGSVSVVYTSGSGYSATSGQGGSGMCIVEYQVYL